MDRMYRVTPGGLFHTHKVKYSPETEKFIRELIRESKLSTFQRKKVEESVKKGEPLPLPPSKTTRGIVHNNNQALGNAQIKCCIPRRRKKEVIQQSGAYEREMFTPTYDKANHDVEKVKLQEVMAFGRTLKSGKQRKVPVSLQLNESNVKIEVCKKTALDKIADDIEDRKQFLDKMESIGQGKKYREMILQEIQEKLKLADSILNEVEQYGQIDKSDGS